MWKIDKYGPAGPARTKYISHCSPTLRSKKIRPIQSCRQRHGIQKVLLGNFTIGGMTSWEGGRVEIFFKSAILGYGYICIYSLNKLLFYQNKTFYILKTQNLDFCVLKTQSLDFYVFKTQILSFKSPDLVSPCPQGLFPPSKQHFVYFKNTELVSPCPQGLFLPSKQHFLYLRIQNWCPHCWLWSHY